MTYKRLAIPVLATVCGLAAAQPMSEPMRDDVPMDVYLSLLSQVAPAARDGAEAYVAAFKTRCGRDLRAIELRRAFANGNGDPTLMAIIRATHERDGAAVQRISATISCQGR